MKEFAQLIDAYDLAKAEGHAMALATVVQVDGSAYRRPGASQSTGSHLSAKIHARHLRYHG